MAFVTSDIIPMGQLRSRFSEIADEARAGNEKIITRNGESYVAIIAAEKLDYYHALEQTNLHLFDLEEAEKGLNDVVKGRTTHIGKFREKHSR